MCELTAGYTKPNCPSTGGTKAVVVYNLENRDTYTVASNAVSAITMKSGKQAWTITPDMASIEITETVNRSRENNSLMYGLSASIMLKDDTVETRALIDLMSKGTLGMIQQKENGSNLHYGGDNGVTVETAEIVTGKNFEDLNGVTINFVGKEKSIAPSIADADITPLLTPA